LRALASSATLTNLTTLVLTGQSPTYTAAGVVAPGEAGQLPPPTALLVSEPPFSFPPMITPPPGQRPLEAPLFVSGTYFLYGCREGVEQEYAARAGCYRVGWPDDLEGW